ncbi:hypothetical protein LQW54_004483 [Pestalotiopsis sp. IQ-011]
MEKKMQALQDALDKITAQIPEINSSQRTTSLIGHESHDPETFLQTGAQADSSQLIKSWDVVIDPGTGAGAAPGSCITSTIDATPPTVGQHLDLVSKGIISTESAESYFCVYMDRLDHFVYSILGHDGYDSLDVVRHRSPLLAAAICTVGALHSRHNEADYNFCRKELVYLSEKTSIVPNKNLDDARAFCIGSLWLADLAWPLASLAVRLATELQLYKSLDKAIQGDRQHYLRARLYYHVYISDHHASIAFGRPPLTRESEPIRNAREFLRSKHATEDDARLVSQVCRWSLLSEIYDTFGVDIDRPLSAKEVSQVRRLRVSLDSLRAEWSDKFVPNVHVGNYPRKGVSLQYYFAKLYLCSHAFRGPASPTAVSLPPDLLIERDEIADTAVAAAMAILRYIITDAEAQSFLNGLPTYFHVMVAFAFVFLMKVSAQSMLNIRLHEEEVKSLTLAALSALKVVTCSMHHRHLLVSITASIGDVIPRTQNTEDQSTAVVPDLRHEMEEPDLLGHDLAFDPYFLSTYDFQMHQMMDFDIDNELGNDG